MQLGTEENRMWKSRDRVQKRSRRCYFRRSGWPVIFVLSAPNRSTFVIDLIILRLLSIHSAIILRYVISAGLRRNIDFSPSCLIALVSHTRRRPNAAARPVKYKVDPE